MPRFKLSKFVSEHSLADIHNFEDLHPKADLDAGQNGSNSAQGTSIEEDPSTASIPLEKTLNAETNAQDVAFNDGSISGNSVKSNSDSQELIKTDENTGTPESISRSVSAPGIKSFTSIDTSDLTWPWEYPDGFYDSEKLTSVRVTPFTTRTSVSSLETQKGKGRNQGSDEMNSESKRGNTNVPLENELNTSLGKGLVMVLDEFNTLRRISQQEELVKHLQANPAQNPEAIKALDNLQNKDVEKIQHFYDLGEHMMNLYTKKEICDVEIHVDNDVLSAHRTVLSCFSSYFSDLFSKRTGKYQVPVVVRVCGVSSDVFRLFLDFAYDRKIDINFEILAEVTKMAKALGIPVLREHCLKLMEDLSLEKAIQCLRENQHSPNSCLYAIAVARVAREFSQVYHFDEFFKLDVDTVCRILSSHHLRISTEMDVFRVALKWIVHSMNERRQHLSRVMKYNQYPYMTQMELFECFEIFDKLKECSKIRKIILQANWINTAEILKLKDPLNFPKVPAARTCFTELEKISSTSLISNAPPEVLVYIEPSSSKESTHKDLGQNKPQEYGNIVATGEYLQNDKGSENTQVKLVEIYNSSQNQWSHYTNLPEPRFHYTAVDLNGKMYIVGGSDPKIDDRAEVPTNASFVFDYETKVWEKIRSMNTPRMHHAICNLHGMLYVIGGEGEKSRILSSVECYNPKTNQWFFVKPMLTPRSGASAAALEGKIVVTGGYGGSTHLRDSSVLKSVESYDPKINRWKLKGQLRFPRYHSNLVNVQGDLYLCGGATSSFVTNNPILTSVWSIDKYSQNRDIWEHKASLNTARHNAGCTVIGERIYIIGGVSTEVNKTLQSVECFDVTKEEWIDGIKELPFPAKWLSCITLPA